MIGLAGSAGERQLSIGVAFDVCPFVGRVHIFAASVDVGDPKLVWRPKLGGGPISRHCHLQEAEFDGLPNGEGN